MKGVSPSRPEQRVAPQRSPALRCDDGKRTLLIHGARSALISARTAQRRGQPLNRTQQWALALAERKGHNKAAVALANKTARQLWAAEHHGTGFDPDHRSVRDVP